MLKEENNGLYMPLLQTFVFVVIVILSLGVAAVPVSAELEWNSIAAERNVFRDIALNNQGLYVVVGNDGLIKTSYDLKKWTFQYSNTEESLFGCVWGNNKYVAVGFNGTILFSGNGVKWDYVQIEEEIDLTGITWGEGKFVAVGTTYGLTGTNDIRYILTSTDGTKWTIAKKVFGSFAWDAVDYINGQFIAYNSWDDLAISEDGVNWTIKKFNDDKRINSIIWDGKKYVALGDNSSIWTSVNALDWTPVQNNIQDGLYIDNLILYNDRYYAAAWFNSKMYVIVSEDLEHWKMAGEHGFENVSKMISTKGWLVTVGTYETVSMSKDGIKWDERKLFSTQLKKVVFNGEKVLAIGYDGTIMGNDGSGWEIIQENVMKQD